MSADRLREAARVLRERAERSVPAPWTLDARNDGRAWVRMARDQRDDITAHGYPSTAAYIATMHPGVGLALADWLEFEAEDFPYIDPERSQAVRIADLILGSAS